MRWTLAFLALIAVVAAAGCGGGGGREAGHARPVALQLRDALQQGFHQPPSLGAVQRYVTPVADVKSCVGPAGGRAGTYRCALTPHRAWMPRVLSVAVDRHGAWRTLTVVRSRSVQAFWGAGLVLSAR